MPAARESLLEAAHTALAHRAWSAVRMVDVAADAGVSRQTLYNEFGSKDGLARAVVRREADGFLAGIERALGQAQAEPRERLVAVAEWTVTAARTNPVVRAVLTGCWGERLPTPPLTAVRSAASVPAQRRADGPLPSPSDVVLMIRDRAVAALLDRAVPRPDVRELARDCELVVRLAVSCVVAPTPDGVVGRLARDVLAPAQGRR